MWTTRWQDWCCLIKKNLWISSLFDKEALINSNKKVPNKRYTSFRYVSYDRQSYNFFKQRFVLETHSKWYSTKAHSSPFTPETLKGLTTICWRCHKEPIGAQVLALYRFIALSVIPHPSSSIPQNITWPGWTSPRVWAQKQSTVWKITS